MIQLETLQIFHQSCLPLCHQKLSPGETPTFHIISPSIMLSFNPSKGPSFIHSEVYYNITKPSCYPSME